MTFSETGNKRPSNVAVRKALQMELNKISTKTMMWHLARRHKFGIVVTMLATYVAADVLPWQAIVGITQSLI